MQGFVCSTWRAACAHLLYVQQAGPGGHVLTAHAVEVLTILRGARMFLRVLPNFVDRKEA